MSLADELLADLEEAGLEGDAPAEANNDDIDDIDIDDIDMDTGWKDSIDPASIHNVAR